MMMRGYQVDNVIKYLAQLYTIYYILYICIF